MLADEMERALDWQLPPSIADGAELYTTIVMLPRSSMPHRMMALKWFPILADSVTRLAALVPFKYWDNDYLRQWKRQSTKTILQLKLAGQ